MDDSVQTNDDLVPFDTVVIGNGLPQFRKCY